MDHETVVERFPDLLEGRLASDDREAVVSHLDRCEECRRLSELYRVLGSAGLAASGHPSAAEIVELATESGDLPEPDRQAMETHIAQCELCRAEVGAVRRVEADTGARPDERASVRRVPAWAGAVAASLLAAALIYPAYRGLVVAPRLQEDVRSLEEQLADVDSSRSRVASTEDLLRATGPTDLWVLTDARRGEAGPAEIRLGGPFLLLGVDLTVPGDLADEVSLVFELLGPEGVVRSATTSAGTVREQILRNGVATLSFLADGLGAGSYSLHASVADRALIEYPITLLAPTDQNGDS